MIREDAERITRELFAAYPGTALREETPKVYLKYLTRLDAEPVARVVPELIETMSQLPTIADVRRRINEAQLELPTPLEAYHSLSAAPGERHLLTRYVAEIFGGTYNIQISDAPAATRAQFMNYYEALRDAALHRGSLPRAVLEFAERAASAEPQSPEESPFWLAIRTRFDALPDAERETRLEKARKELLKGGQVSPRWVAQPVVEYEALRSLAEENGWLEEAS
ncbi:MAG TPA: hypothetical protein VF101_17880 [Gaiellaceae bacterium]